MPRIDIVDKEVIYRSKIYFTPLRSATEIDAEAVKRIVREEYQAAGMTPEMLRTGAVIITGETARKENANEVLELCPTWPETSWWPPPDRIWSRYSPPGGRAPTPVQGKAHGHRQCGHRRRDQQHRRL